MTLRFEPMTESEYQTFITAQSLSYAEDRARLDFETMDEARQAVKEMHRQLLPQGRSTPLHHFFNVCLSQAQVVGHVWLKVDPQTRLAWLYYIEIDPAQRGRGYGEQAMHLVMAKAKDLGARVFWLNVMSYNAAAQRLYEKVGLQTATLHMNKLL